jgi:hypothetical protein
MILRVPYLPIALVALASCSGAPGSGLLVGAGAGAGAASEAGLPSSGLEGGTGARDSGRRDSGSASSSGSGSSGSGSAPGGSCDWTGGPAADGNGELTCYWFGQGTSTARSSYKTGCGYVGTESGNANGGGSCGQTSFTDSVTNIANPTFFAAYKDSSPTDPMNCGLCVEISYGGHTITATVVDDCATCDDSEHLDLSMSAANALGLTQSNGNPHSGVSWKSVSCPVKGDIVASYNLDSNSGQPVPSQVYFQNVVFPVASASSGAHSASFSHGFWDFGTAMPGQPVTLTDAVGHTTTGTIPANANGGSIGTQFAETCQ